MDKTKKRKRLNKEEREYLLNHIPKHSYKETSESFNEKFCEPVTVNQVKNFASKNGLAKNLPVIPHPKGSLRLHNGYTLIKVDEIAEWRELHKVVWEEKNGPIPEGHVLIFADGNKQNCSIDNLLLVTKAENVTMNKYSLRSSDAELTKLGVLTARLFFKIHERKAGIK